MDLEEKNLRDKIDYWKKHQELDKFNYQINTDSINNITFLWASFFIPVIGAGISLIIQKNFIYGFFLLGFSAIFFPLMVITNTSKNKEIKNGNNESFMIREAMLRIFYKKLNVNTDLLDEQFEEIKKMSKKRISKNKQLEIFATKIIDKE
ncbi:MAG: hypothetical protein V1888_03965 [archaeon]